MSPRTCCFCGYPQGWEHGQVISRADQQCHLSSAHGDQGCNSWAGKELLSGNFRSCNLIWSMYWEYYRCVLLNQLLGNLSVVPRNGQRVHVLFAGGNFLLRPWSKSFGTREALKVTCVLLSSQLAVAYRVFLAQQQFLSSSHHCLHSLQTMECSPAIGAEYLILPWPSDYLHVYGSCADPFRGFVSANSCTG